MQPISKNWLMKNDNMKNQYRINEQIRVREVRIVGDGGSTVLPTREALDMARDQGVDLVEPEGNEGQAGEGRSQGDTFRTSDR